MVLLPLQLKIQLDRTLEAMVADVRNFFQVQVKLSQQVLFLQEYWSWPVPLY